MTTFQARKLTLNNVHRLLKIVEIDNDVLLTDFFTLDALADLEIAELVRIRQDFRPYFAEKASEGQIKALTVFPLLRLAGFYNYPIQIKIEEGIDNIVIKDEDKIITGCFDIVAVNREQPTVNDVPFWILVIEAKEIAIEVRQGLPQLLAYAYGSLKRQSSVWGLVTNGLQYLFVRISKGNPFNYQLLPILDLMYSTSSIQLLQMLKAIYKLYYETQS